MRIGLFGLFGGGNSGNDASLEAMLAFLRRVGFDQHLTCICPNPERVQQIYGVTSTGLTPKLKNSALGSTIDRLLLRVPHRLFAIWYTIQKIRKLDILIVPGTGFLDDFQDNPFGWPFMVFKWCVTAWVLRKRIIFVSIGAGPIQHWLSRFFMKKAAQTATYRSYRDTISREFLSKIGVNVEKDNIYPDIVFGLPKLVSSMSKECPTTIGVGVMSYFGWAKGNPNREEVYLHYLQKLKTFVTWLLDEGFQVRLLTGDEGDWSAVEDFIEKFDPHYRLPPSGARIVAVRTYALKELMTEIYQTDAVVVTRYHNLVCALKLGRPAVSLEYSKKNHALMAEMNLDKFCQNVETFDLDLLKRQFGEMLQHRDQLRTQILAYDEEFARRLSIQEDELVDFISGTVARPFFAALALGDNIQ